MPYPIYTCKVSVILEPSLFLFSCLLSSCPDVNFFSAACAEVAGVQDKVKKMMKGDKINTSEDRCVQEAEYRDTVGRSLTHVQVHNGLVTIAPDDVPSVQKFSGFSGFSGILRFLRYKNSQECTRILRSSVIFCPC